MNKALESMLREVQTLPEGEQARIARVLEEEVQRAKRKEPTAAGRWARLVERMRREAPMAGSSEAFLNSVRDFREHFDLGVKPADE